MKPAKLTIAPLDDARLKRLPTKTAWAVLRGEGASCNGGTIVFRDANGNLDSAQGFPRRTSDPRLGEATGAWFPDSATFVLAGGIAMGNRRPSRETFGWTQKAGWKLLETTGRPAPRKGGVATRAGDEMIVAGGYEPKRSGAHEVRVTEHFDGTCWTAYADSYDVGTACLTLLATDPPTGVVFALGGNDHVEPRRLWAYAGGGRWIAGPQLDTPASYELDDAQFGIDWTRRRIVAERGGAFYAVSVAEWLDALPPRTRAGMPAKPSKPGTPAKPAKPRGRRRLEQ